MFNITRKEINWGGRPLVFETGKIARQADGAVLVTYGETQVLCTAVANRSASSSAAAAVSGSEFSDRRHAAIAAAKVA